MFNIIDTAFSYGMRLESYSILQDSPMEKEVACS